MVVAAAVHGGFVIALLIGAAASEEFYRAIGDPGAPGGGGGGGTVVRYVELPPVAMARRASERPQPERAAVQLVLPRPDIAALPDAMRPLTPPEVVGRDVAALRLGSGPAGGGGPGAGPGSGGGVGAGVGAGVGSRRGPGSGGEGGDVLPPEPKFIIVPADRPRSVRGREFEVHFWVDATGRVTRVEVEPEIEDADYRRKFLEQMRQFQFTPARTLDGRPVSGHIVIPITL